MCANKIFYSFFRTREKFSELNNFLSSLFIACTAIGKELPIKHFCSHNRL
jgi:hypothetical protein